ncbi:unnamed protein product, partial [Oppiella nova]
MIVLAKIKKQKLREGIFDEASPTMVDDQGGQQAVTDLDLKATVPLANIESYLWGSCLDKEFALSERTIGCGIFGVVVKGRHRLEDRDYAIKLEFICADSEHSLLQECNQKLQRLQPWAELDSIYCAKYRRSWMERDDRSRDRFIDYWRDAQEGRQSKDDIRHIINAVYRPARHYAILH